MRSAANLCCRCTELHRQARLSNKVGHLRPHHVYAEDRATLRMTEHLAETIGIAANVRLSNGEEWHLAGNERHAVSRRELGLKCSFQTSTVKMLRSVQ